MMLLSLIGLVAAAHGQTVNETGVATGTPGTARAKVSVDLMAELSARGIPPTRILGLDARGIPVVCGTDTSKSLTVPAQKSAGTAALPVNVRGWEAIPSVVRINALDTFRLEVNVNSAVTAVTVDFSFVVTPDSGGSHQILRDDGLGLDRVAGDHIWTSGLLHPNVSQLNLWTPPYYGNGIDADTNSPAGLNWWDIGTVQIVELTGETNGFLVNPQFGVMDPHIPLATPLALSSNVQATAHLLNISDSTQGAQKFLRTVSYSELPTVTTALYGAAPDAFDFLTFFTTDHIEQQPYLSSGNFIAGVHTPVKVNYSGTGLSPYDSTAYWGSPGHLLGVSVLDTGDRGTFANNATHELLHQWSCFTDPALGLNDGTGHYNYRSGVGSLLGGTQFIATNGGYMVNCSEGPSGADFASAMDRYMMGLIDGSAVPPVPVASASLGSPFFLCSQVISNFDTIVTIAQIQQSAGVRSPGPATSQHNFTIGFVIESNGRLLNQTELTFFEILARQYTQPVSPSAPAPYLGISGWQPITRFFGSGTTWRSYAPSFVQSRFNSVTPVAGSQVAIGGLGFPGASYTLQGSTNLADWNTVATLRAGTNGALQYTNPMAVPRQFYRAVWNE